MIDEANTLLNRAIARMEPGPHQVQAVIAGHHANATTAAQTDWPAIEALYRQLMAMTTSPVVAVNHAVAVAMADGPHRGLALLESIDGLEQYHLYHAAAGRAPAAAAVIQHGTGVVPARPGVHRQPGRAAPPRPPAPRSAGADLRAMLSLTRRLSRRAAAAPAARTTAARSERTAVCVVGATTPLRP